jgi:hypothetical protein
MSEDATIDPIPEDASTVDPNPVSDPIQPDASDMLPRELELERIATKRAEERRGDPPESDINISPDLQPSAKAQEPQETISFYDENGQEYEVPKTAKMRIKVEGAELEEPISKIATTYQKGATGDNRLREAAAKLKDLEDREEALNARGEALTQQEQAAKAKLSRMEQQLEVGSLSDDDYLKAASDLMTTLYSGEIDDEKRASTIAETLKKISRPQQTVDPNRLSEEVEARVLSKVDARDEKKEAVRYQEEVKKANEKFGAEERFKLIVGDDDLYAMAARKVSELQKQKPNAPVWSIIEEAGNQVLEFVGKFAGEKKAPAQTRKPMPTPRTASSRASIGQDPPKPQTRAEVLAELRKARVA